MCTVCVNISVCRRIYRCAHVWSVRVRVYVCVHYASMYARTYSLPQQLEHKCAYAYVHIHEFRHVFM